jgi:hypothetical protein
MLPGTELHRQGHNFVRGFRNHRMLYAVSLLFVVYSYALTAYVGLPLDPFSGLIFIVMVLAAICIAVLALVLWKMGHLILIERPDNPAQVLWRWLVQKVTQDDRLTNIVHLTIIVWPLLVCFSNVKSAIPLVQPFAWDEAFMQLDKTLHFGWHPWQLLQPVLGSPMITVIINFFYNLWFFVMFFCLFLQGFGAKNTALRYQYLIAFLLAWFVAGSILAIAFSSAGPCYYTRIGLSPDPYTPLMTYLLQANEVYPIWALTAQDMLWQAYSGEDSLVSGISAMPSLHVTVVTLQAIMGWRMHRWLGWLLTIYAGFILLGSVHLAWHYAVDGYLAIILAFAIWWIAGRIAAWDQASDQLTATAAVKR